MHFSYTNHVVVQNIYNLAGREGGGSKGSQQDTCNLKKCRRFHEETHINTLNGPRESRIGLAPKNRYLHHLLGASRSCLLDVNVASLHRNQFVPFH